MKNSRFKLDPKACDIAIEAVRTAGMIIRDNRNVLHRAKHKGRVDLVTEIDLMAEKSIIAVLERQFPDFQIIAEEGGGKKRSSDYIWWIDPLDGTTNFAHGYPHYSVSLALEYRGEIVLGVVYDPLRDELFSAVRGKGALLNGMEIRVSNVKQLEESLLATGFPYNLKQRPRAVAYVDRLLPLIQGVRRDGSAALNLAYTATGRLDGYWESTLKPWDCAAGLLLVEEGGGVVSDFQGGDFSLPGGEIVAANPFIHPLLIDILITV